MKKDTNPHANPTLFPGELEAVRQAIEAGHKYGFGNLIAHLQRAWALRLIKSGVPERGAIAATQGRTPYPLHDTWFKQFDSIP